MEKKKALERDIDMAPKFTYRTSAYLYNRVKAESNKTGNSINGEISSLILDGLRFRESKVIVQLEEQCGESEVFRQENAELKAKLEKIRRLSV